MKKAIILLFLVIATGTYAWADSLCDINDDGKTGLEEAIYALQVTAGIRTEPVPPVSNSLGMTFNYIEPGTFTMGSPPDEAGRYYNETQHSVTLTNAFYIQTTEVIQSQWQTVMGSNPSYFSGCPSCPVETVSWDDVQLFLTAINALNDGIYRLPTEAEWEYACRSGSSSAFANGGITYTDYSPVDPNLDLIGWYYGNSDTGSGYKPQPVGGKDPNAWGLYDMHGNVFEWCQDWGEPYPRGNVTDPTGPASGSFRVLRGGGWLYRAEYCRSA
ncbi:MAG: formylglycine-generating enzyme family protein, partial [bacterium]|nr:formylglycine-generating enzyme family protein [bacterium]